MCQRSVGPPDVRGLWPLGNGRALCLNGGKAPQGMGNAEQDFLA